MVTANRDDGDPIWQRVALRPTHSAGGTGLPRLTTCAASRFRKRICRVAEQASADGKLLGICARRLLPGAQRQMPAIARCFVIVMLCWPLVNFAWGQVETAPDAAGPIESAPPVLAPLAPLLGDFVHEGVRTADGRTDIVRLLEALKRIGARDYLHLVWTEAKYPHAWDDFALLAREFAQAKLGLWLYLTPPSAQGGPEPFGVDYVRWAVQCAKIAREFPAVKGLCIDDFNGAVKTLTPSYCRQMMTAARQLAPDLRLLAVCYFGYEHTIARHVEQGAIDGVIFPYFYPHLNHSDTTQLRPQIEHYRAWLDARTGRGRVPGRMPLVVMVYAQRHSESTDAPTPEYVKTAVQIGLHATDDGLADGVVTYCLPKDDQRYLRSLAEVFTRWRTPQ